MTAAPSRIDRTASLSRAFEFLALLVGRDRVELAEIQAAMGCHRRTVIRYAHAAENAGLIEWHQAKPVGNPTSDDRSWVRLLNARLRRCA